MKQCVSCFAWKKEEEFNLRYKSLGIRHPTCRDCHKVHRDKWYQSHREAELERVRERKQGTRITAKQYVIEYLVTHPCVDCGEADPVVLEFDHVNGKDATLARLMADGATIERIQREIDRCVVRCSNCHKRKTAKEMGWFKVGF